MKKLTFGTKLAYGIGQMGDSIGYNLFYFFFLFFLTDYAGISPGIAGSISLIAVVWDAITDPLIGYLSDKFESKYGRRRPFMLVGVIPYALLLWLMFINVDFQFKSFYYIGIAILFWTFYTVYVIPYFALGAEITQDPDERTSLRSYGSLFIYLAVMLASALPPVILDKTTQLTGSSNLGWSNVGLILGFLVFLCAFICWNCTRGMEKSSVREEGAPAAAKENIFKSYLEVLKLKPSRFLAISVAIFVMVTVIGGSGIVYIMNNNMGMSAGQVSTFFVFNSLVSIAMIPFVNYAAKKFDKRSAYIVALSICGVGMASLYFIGFTSYITLALWSIFINIGAATFWTLYYSMNYDICEVDEFINGKRREGAIISIIAFFQKLGSAIAMWLTGQMLEFVGYDGAASVQTPEVLDGIVKMNTFLPAVLAFAAVIFAVAFPITRKRFELLMAALENKRAGLEYSTDGFEKILK